MNKDVQVSLTVNHNAMAANASRNLAATYGKLSTSVQRMSSGLRINSAADDAAGLAIREMMRADIAATRHGIRNTADAISMIQTADGALAVIDEKLTRMKELAEQAATGTYTTVQRDIINSEYQAMAAEIDRIANATNFNGIKLLDGSVTNQHSGHGIKIHFGTSNNAAEDYYFINIDDVRATSSTGLRIGGDAKNDIWGQGAAASGALAGPGCCTAGFSSLNKDAGFNSGQSFSYGYNWDWLEDTDENLLSGKYLAGRYTVSSGDSLQDLANKVNQGTQSRVGLRLDSPALNAALASGGLAAICVGDEAYVFGSAAVSGAPGHLILSTAATTAKMFTTTYDPGLSYTNYNGRTYVYNDPAVRNALVALGFDSDDLPVQSDGDLNFSGASTADIQNQMAPAHQAAIDAYVAANWAAGRERLNCAGGINYDPLEADLWAATSALVTAALTNGSGDLVIGRSYAVNTGYYANSRGVFTTDATLAAQLGLSEVVVDLSTISDGGGGVRLEAHVGGTQVYGRANATPALIKTAQGLGLSFGLGGIPPGSTGLYQLASGGAYGQPTVNPADIVVTSDFSQAGAVNHNSASAFWAMVDQDDDSIVYVFHKEGGDNNDLMACEVAGTGAVSRAALNAIDFQNVETGAWHDSGAAMTLGGENWGRLTPVQSKVNKGREVWNVTLEGRDVGRERDLWIANLGDLNLPGLEESIINGLDRDSFMEIQNAADANWRGAEVRTQSSARESLDALTVAITRKDKIRADLGAMQNRLENTMTNLEIQAESLQAAESHISDVDVAKEMTEFTKNNLLVQAAASMLAQANSMSQLALSLMG